MTTRKIDAVKLSALAADIDRDGTDRFVDLRHRLETEEGLKLTEKRKGSGHFVATMAGITGESLDGERIAIENWAAAARRAVLEAGRETADALPVAPEA